MAERTVFFADVLGFGTMARRRGATQALDTLSDLANILSSQRDVVKHIQSEPWVERYALSDSIFLVAEDLPSACVAASELFFNLAYMMLDSSKPILLRGAISRGEVLRADAIFPESGTANLVGSAVVEAVSLEKSGAKGPRLLMSKRAAAELKSDPVAHSGAAWNLDQTKDGSTEVLWFLPSRVEDANGLMIGEVCAAAARLFLEHGLDPGIGPHYSAYLGMALRSLMRLKDHSPTKADEALRAAHLAGRKSQIMSLLLRKIDPHLAIISDLAALLS